MKRPRIWTLLALLLGAAAAAVAAPADPPLAPLAHSALITLEGATLPDAMILRVRSNTGGPAPVVSDFALKLDGRAVPAALQPDGNWRTALQSGATAPARFEAAITHDGIRELLSGAVASAAGAVPAAGGALGVHKQIVWWVLNVLIVLVAAIAISRRTS